MQPGGPGDVRAIDDCESLPTLVFVGAISRLLLLLAAGLAAQGCANHPGEKMMNLDLETKSALQEGETPVEALLRNSGTEPVTVLLEPRLFHPSAGLTDDRGKLLAAGDGRAMKGRRAQGEPPKTFVLKPGDQVHIESSASMPSVERAMAGALSRDLKNVRSRSLTLEMISEVTEKASQEAKLLKGPGVAAGTWSSKPVMLPCK
jgi:hypothetical protein